MRLRHLAADHPAAEHQQPARRRLGVGGLAAGPRPRLAQAGHRRHGRRGAGGQHDGVPGGQRPRVRRPGWRPRRSARRPAARARGRRRRRRRPATPPARCRRARRACPGPGRRRSPGGRRRPRRPARAVSPGSRRAPATSSTGRSRALLGMQAQYEHSPPTSSCSTSTADRPPRWARSAAFSPGGPPPITTTSYSLHAAPSARPDAEVGGERGRIGEQQRPHAHRGRAGDVRRAVVHEGHLGRRRRPARPARRRTRPGPAWWPAAGSCRSGAAPTCIQGSSSTTSARLAGALDSSASGTPAAASASTTARLAGCGWHPAGDVGGVERGQLGGGGGRSRTRAPVRRRVELGPVVRRPVPPVAAQKRVHRRPAVRVQPGGPHQRPPVRRRLLGAQHRAVVEHHPPRHPRILAGAVAPAAARGPATPAPEGACARRRSSSDRAGRAVGAPLRWPAVQVRSRREAGRRPARPAGEAS